MYGQTNATNAIDLSRSGYADTETRKDQPKLANIRDSLNDAHGRTLKALDEIDAALDRIDGSVPKDSIKSGGSEMPAVTLVGSLGEQVNFAQMLSDRAQALASRLAALG